MKPKPIFFFFLDLQPWILYNKICIEIMKRTKKPLKVCMGSRLVRPSLSWKCRAKLCFCTQEMQTITRPRAPSTASTSSTGLHRTNSVRRQNSMIRRSNAQQSWAMTSRPLQAPAVKAAGHHLAPTASSQCDLTVLTRQASGWCWIGWQGPSYSPLGSSMPAAWTRRLACS